MLNEFHRAVASALEMGNGPLAKPGGTQVDVTLRSEISRSMKPTDAPFVTSSASLPSVEAVTSLTRVLLCSTVAIASSLASQGIDGKKSAVPAM